MTNAGRDDAPPAAAVGTVARLTCGGTCDCAGKPLHPICAAEAEARLQRLRALPDADLWRLIGWLADKREPTREMHKAACDCIEEAARLNYGTPAAYQDIWDAILAAAKETRDE